MVTRVIIKSCSDKLLVKKSQGCNFFGSPWQWGPDNIFRSICKMPSRPSKPTSPHSSQYYILGSANPEPHHATVQKPEHHFMLITSSIKDSPFHQFPAQHCTYSCALAPPHIQYMLLPMSVVSSSSLFSLAISVGSFLPGLLFVFSWESCSGLSIMISFQWLYIL